METLTEPNVRRGRVNSTVGNVMHAGVVTCSLDTPIPEVARLMTQRDVSAIPVVDERGHMAGIITRTDLVTLRAYEDYWREMNAEHVMVRQVSTIAADESIAVASRLLSDNRIHRLIVVEPDRDGALKPIGILSQTDIVRDMALE